MPGLSLSPMIFSNLDLPDYAPVYMRWLNPESDEPISEYAQRVIALYEIPNDDSVLLIGHSLGGIIVQEMATYLDKVKVAIISSVKSPDELPRKIKMLRYGYAYHLAGKKFIKATIDLWGSYHGYDSQELKDILIDEAETLDSSYYIWAYKQVIYWKGISLDRKIIHIHGSEDRTFPVDDITQVRVIRGGDHLMLYKKSEVVRRALTEALSW